MVIDTLITYNIISEVYLCSIPKFPPVRVILSSVDSVIEYIPAPFVHYVTERQKDNLLKSRIE